MPRVILPLSKEDDHRIKRNWTFLKTNLVQHEIRDLFLVEAIWDLRDFDRIDAEKTPEEKNEMFLKLLLQSGPRAYKAFITALQENNLTHIVEKLQQTITAVDHRERRGRHYCYCILRNMKMFYSSKIVYFKYLFCLILGVCLIFFFRISSFILCECSAHKTKLDILKGKPCTT